MTPSPVGTQPPDSWAPGQVYGRGTRSDITVRGNHFVKPLDFDELEALLKGLATH